MPASKAQQKAVSKYMKENYDVFQIRMPKGRKETIQTAAAAAGESVNAYINTAITQRMEQDASGSPSEPFQAPGSILTPATLETAQKAAEFTGETVSAFLERAAEVQAERDQRSHGMADKIAGVKHSKERG